MNEGQENRETPPDISFASEDLSKLEKYLQRILNSGMKVSNAVKDIRGENQQTLDKLEAFIVNVLQAGERREAKTQATFEAFQASFRQEIAALRGEISGALREEAFLIVAQDWIGMLDDIDALIQATEETAGEAAGWSQSLVVLSRRCLAVLRDHGFEEQAVIPGETDFDPELHQAQPPSTASEVVRAAAVPSGTILVVKKRGFALRGRPHRPAQVVVAPRGPEPPRTQDPSDREQ